VLAAIFYSLTMLALLALVTAIFSGISKLAIDASIQERVPERHDVPDPRGQAPGPLSSAMRRRARSSANPSR